MDALFGMEWEMGLCSGAVDDSPLERPNLLEKLCSLAAAKLPNLPALGESGIMLGSGGRLYVDCSVLLEYASPECSDPADVVRSMRAFERSIVPLCAELAAHEGVGELALTRCNVDYRGNTYGAHESYLTRTDPRKLAPDLVPFLASRVVLGAGGFDARTPTGCWFTLSPRAGYIIAPSGVSGSSTSDRGLVHIRDQPLAKSGYHRLHLLGEAVCSSRGTWLRIASTALVVAMADLGLCPGSEVALPAPIDALRTFAADIHGQAKAKARSGRLSALDIQRHYLALARQHRAKLPPFAELAIETWDGMLSRLTNLDAVATTLDWAIKYRFFSTFLERKGLTWQMMEDWSLITDLLYRCAQRSSPAGKPIQFDASLVLESKENLREIVNELEPQLATRGLQWSGLEDYLRVRMELFALDFRFSELGENGLFNRLDAAGVLDHSFPGVDRIEEATRQAPGSGRAKIRGDVIRRCRGQRNRYAANWTTVIDRKAKRTLDLRDPFISIEKWARSAPDQDDDNEVAGDTLEESLEHLSQLGLRPSEFR